MARSCRSLSLHKLVEQEPTDIPEYAALYISMDLGVVPNQRGSKKPTVKNWPAFKARAEDVPSYFDNGKNVGLLLGVRSGGLVDIDLDCSEARAAADLFLPNTLTAGRKSAPRSHRFVISPGAKSRSWRMSGKDGQMLVEVRSTGAQTLVEPSVHPSGERYEWDREGALEAVEIPAEQLELLCAKIATAAAIACRLPAGGRHDFAMALAGYMLRPGRLDEKTTREVLLAAWRAAGADSPEALDDVERAVRDTAQKIFLGDRVTGGPTLGEMVPDLLALLARWWGWDSSEQAEDGDAAGGGGAPTDDVLRDRFSETHLTTPTAWASVSATRAGCGIPYPNS